VKAYPVDASDPNAFVSGVICIWVSSLEKVFLFKFSKTIVLPVTDFVLRGMEAPIYQHIAQRLYRPNIIPLQAQLLSLYLLTQASKTSTVIGEPFSIVYAMARGMFIDDRRGELDLLTNSLVKVQQAMDDLLLICTDTNAATDGEVKRKLREFQQQIMGLRKEQARRQDQLFTKRLRSLPLR